MSIATYMRAMDQGVEVQNTDVAHHFDAENFDIKKNTNK